MGADRRMYPAPWMDLPDFVAHDWTRYSGEKSIAEVAQSTCDAADIRDGDTLIGSSLGGIVACEITNIRKISALFLIGSATHKEEINKLLAVLHPLARVAPIDWLKFSAAKIPSELAQMFAGIEPSFTRAMCDAIFEWKGLKTSLVKVYRIHGKYDFVIPPPPKTDLLLNGGHLILISHANECAEFIKRVCSTAG
jgi:hypothetical protein